MGMDRSSTSRALSARSRSAGFQSSRISVARSVPKVSSRQKMPGSGSTRACSKWVQAVPTRLAVSARPTTARRSGRHLPAKGRPGLAALPAALEAGSPCIRVMWAGAIAERGDGRRPAAVSRCAALGDSWGRVWARSIASRPLHRGSSSRRSTMCRKSTRSPLTPCGASTKKSRSIQRHEQDWRDDRRD